MLPEEDITSKQAQQKYKPYFEFCDELLGLAIEMTDKDRLKIFEKELVFAIVALGLYSKACKTFRAIHILCAKPLGEDANTLLRVLMETSINVYYIAADKKVRSQLFIDKMIKNSHRLGMIIKQNKKLRSMGFIPEDGWGKVKEMVEEIKKNTPKESFLKNLKKIIIENILNEKIMKVSTWSGESLQNMAYKTGLRDIYDLTNPLTSRAIHSEDIPEHVDFDEKTGIYLKIVPGDKWVNPVLPSAILIFLSIVDKINSLFELGKDREIEVFFEKFKKFQEEGPQPL